MTRDIDLEKILEPIPGDNPAGEDLRYAPIYDEIKEARRADDDLPFGKWERERKKAEWDKVIALAVAALTDKTKDLQIAAWLMEALTITEGFAGVAFGLKVVNGLLARFWEQVYPVIEDGDLDFRAAPIEFLNDRLWVAIKQIPLTEPRVTAAYPWLKWKESREVGYEADLRKEDGSTNEDLRKSREEKIAEGKLKPEDFDIAMQQSSDAFYQSLIADLNACEEEFNTFENLLDAQFGSAAPSTANFRDAIQDCQQTIKRISDKRFPKAEPKTDLGGDAEPAREGGLVSRLFRRHRAASPEMPLEADNPAQAGGAAQALRSLEEIPLEESASMPPVGSIAPLSLRDSEALETARWNEALQIMATAGMKKALGQLLAAAHSAPSVRARNRYRLLVAKLCLEAGRADLARPIVEELNALIEEFQLERWESPLWIAEVLDALYQCLTVGDLADEDLDKARALFQKLCRTDVTKAMWYKS